ncbi:hypothetical protein QQ045_005778 [Rhodiola kirilowii]
MRTLQWLVSLLILSSSGNMSSEASLCGKIRLQSPFEVLSGNSSTSSSLLSNMILCRSGKLYFRTSIGLFAISSIDYTAKTLTLVPNDPQSCSESATFISPALLSAGFPSQPNSLLLFNCRNQGHHISYPIQNCSGSRSCNHLDTFQEKGHSCLLVQDIEKLGKGFHPRDLNCSHYTSVHRSSSTQERGEKYNLGMKVSFEIDHKPDDLCQECKRPNGRCGVGLKCFCHLEQCVDKVVTGCTSIMHKREIVISSLFSTAVLLGFLLQKI